MKTKILIIIASLACLTASAQTNYYAGTTAKGTNVTYRVDHTFQGSYEVTNINNTRVGQPIRLLNGTIVPVQAEWKYDATQIGDFLAIARTILQEVFTQSELTALINQNQVITMNYIIEPSGNIAEISTVLIEAPLQYSISPDKLYSWEQKIKDRMKYNVSATGKTAQFIVAFAIWNFKNIFKDDVSTVPPPPASSAPLFGLSAAGDITPKPEYINPIANTGTVQKWVDNGVISFKNGKTYTINYGILQGYLAYQSTAFNVIAFSTDGQPVLALAQPAPWSLLQYTTLSAYSVNNHCLKVNTASNNNAYQAVIFIGKPSSGKSQVTIVAATPKEIKLVYNKDMAIKSITEKDGDITGVVADEYNNGIATPRKIYLHPTGMLYIQ